ncbi:hypothetical protein PQX77_010380 [Marasmius sp. AFHP31]|nr:hypothetical protein PQX77_010380 [Marasmius sp. AFHP31]
MSMFHSARRTKIIGGNFSIVQGNQNNNSCSHSQSGERSLVRIQPGEEWKEMLYQEYERISLGKIKLLETLRRESPIAPSRRRRIMANEEGCPEAERVVEIASIVDGREESLPLLAVRYAGRDAKELFKKDCIHFARHRDSTMPQFRAFNDSDIPIIIFNEDLIPASHFLSQNLYSVHAQCYLYFLANWGALLYGSSDEHRAWVLSISKSYFNITHLLWFRPQTGVLCFGPPGPRPEYKPSRSSIITLHPSRVEYSQLRFEFELPRNPLPLNVCTNTTFFDYIMRNVPEWFAVCTMSAATVKRNEGPIHRGVCDWKGRLMAEESWTTSWNSRNFSRLVPKLLPSDQWHSTCTYGFMLDEQDQCRLTGKGGMRLHIAHSINSAGFFFQRPTNNFPYYTIREGWLAQAGHIFRSLRVSREKWSSFAAIIQGFSLRLSSDARELFGTEYTNCNEFLGLPCYLFLPPPPKLPNGAPDIETWLRGENLYYYSYDPEGGSAITEQERIALGLPSYTSQVQVEYAHWEADAYDFMKQWQEAKGFDYSTPDYAKSLGFTIFEGIPQDKLRFDDLIGAHYEGILPPSPLARRQGTNVSPSSVDCDLPEVPADDSMDVDCELGNARGDCIPSSSDVDMDVDDY